MKNVFLSVHAEVALYLVKTIKTCPLLRPAVDVRTILLDRTTRLKHFFTLQSREAQCIVATHFQPKFCPLLRPAVDVRTILLDRTTRLKHFFTLQSREAQCIVATHFQPKFWKPIDNNGLLSEGLANYKANQQQSYQGCELELARFSPTRT